MAEFRFKGEQSARSEQKQLDERFEAGDPDRGELCPYLEPALETFAMLCQPPLGAVPPADRVRRE